MYTAPQLLEQINSYIASLAFARFPKDLYSPIEYELSLGGKRIRPLFLMMAYNLYKEQVEPVYSQAVAIEMYHNYTLLHDDLMDRSDMRRGKPTVHKVWGENTAILSGDAMLVLAYQYIGKCATEHLKPVLDLFSATALEICEGQQLDMEFEKRMDVEADEYIEMIRLKTAVLLAASFKIGALLGGASQTDIDNFYKFGIQIGLAFQLQDDLLDVYGNSANFGKKIGGDILCNKKTYLLIKALELADQDQKTELHKWLSVESCNGDEKIAAVTELYNQIGVKQVCEQKIQAYYAEAMRSLADIQVAEANKQELINTIKTLINREV